MLAQTESHSGTRTHEPLRNSTLRQVTLTDENPETGPTHTNPQHPHIFATSQLAEWKNLEKFVKLGIHDSVSLSSSALLDPRVFPEGAIRKGTLITISPARDTGPAVDGQSHNGKGGKKVGRPSAHELESGNRRYLFAAEPIRPDSSGNLSDVRVDDEDYQASHVEIAFRDEYLSRSDMWRLVVSELAGKVIQKGQRLAFMGTIKVLIKTIYVRGQRVQSAFFSASTKPIFRSESARYVLFIQMSEEMWSFDTDGTGEIMFDKVVNGFLPDLFKRWQQINARHLVTIVMFSRLEFTQGPRTGPVSLGILAAEHRTTSGSPFQDFYRVVVSDMPSGGWSEIMIQLKKEFRVFLRDVSIRKPTTEKCPATKVHLQEASDDTPSHVITGHPVPASRGNILEAVNLASSQFSCDYIDRDLVRTGISVIVITPGTGLFEVEYNLLAATTDNLIENGVGIDLVCLSRLPLHSVPLFKYRPPQSNRVRRLSSSSHEAREASAELSKDHLTIPSRQPGSQEGHMYGCLGSGPGASHGTPDLDWRYAIPHWIDVSFWSTPLNETRGLTVGLGKSVRPSQRQGRRNRKSFTPRVRMYELQMMGVTENSVNRIRLPYLSESTTNVTHSPSDPSSLPNPTPPGNRKPARGHSSSRQFTGANFLPLSSSIASTSSLSVMRSSPLYRWMDEYDQTLFQHPKKRQRALKSLQQSKLTFSMSDRKQQHDRIKLTPGTSLYASHSPSGSIRGSDVHRNTAWPRKGIETTGTATGDFTGDSAAVSATSNALHLRPPRISRQISLGFQGFGVSMPKATASTEISTAHAKPSSVTYRRQYSQRKSQDGLNAISKHLPPSEKQNGRELSGDILQADDLVPELSQDQSPTRPMPIRNPTEIRILSGTEDLEPLNHDHSTRLFLHPNEDSMADHSWQQLSSLSSEADHLPEHNQLPLTSPKAAMAPWLTVVNPSNPKQTESNSASRLGRWQHIFPKKLRASKIKWKSLCSPAAVPLTTEDFPSADELVTDYHSSKHKVDLPTNDELLERPRSNDWLVREMMAFRFSQGFQVIVGSRLADALYLPNFERFDVFDDGELARTDTTIVMSRGSVIHKISATEPGQVEVECLTRRTVAAQHKNDSSDVYKPLIRTMLGEEYLMQEIAVYSGQRKLEWSLIDARIAGHPKQEVDHKDENLRSWRARLVLIPVNPSSSTRRPLQPLNEDNEEELRLEGIRKLTQIWQRFRHVPPSERRFQAPLRKRKDQNPLDIMYQTRNPSAIVAAEKDNMGEDVSTGKPVQLLPESELFQRSNLNLQLLSQTMQGEKGVRMMDRRWHWRLHYNCFIGFELTSWLLQNFRDVDTREEAVELGNDLMKNGLFQHVEQRHNFRDGNYFYQVASEYRSTRPESRSTWFGSRKADKVPSTPVSEGPGQESPKPPASRSSLTSEEPENTSSAPTTNRQRLGVALSKSLLYDVDHRKRSYRPELITLHYDRLHNPDNCYHIRIDWMNVTSKLIEDAIVSWATLVDRFGLKLVEVPLAEASTITSMHPFRAPATVKLAKSPPAEQPQTYFDATSFTPQAKTEKLFYQKALMKKFGFVLDFEAASDFPADVDVSYSWGKPDYKYPQYIHRSGTLLAQITDEGDFLLLANRLYNNRSTTTQDPTRSEDSEDKSSASTTNIYGSTRSSIHRGSPHISPYSSPLFRATPDTSSAPRSPKAASLFATPEEIKKKFEIFCSDAAALESFYNDVLSKASTPAVGTPSTNTPMMESSIPALGLPPSLMERGRSPAPGVGKPKMRIVGGESPRPVAGDSTNTS
ncbi:MAG: hypothetical protein Q9225_002286 [Loekoesia sp. 1 TL-2023]